MVTQSDHPMNFELTPEQQTLQKAAIEFARRELNSNMIERDAQQMFSHDGWKKCGVFQLHGGRGFLTELELEREMRDSMGSTLYSGLRDSAEHYRPRAADLISTQLSLGSAGLGSRGKAAGQNTGDRKQKTEDRGLEDRE
jgi:hypothetical protein